ncbi:MAG TPA: XRE family transcriptional regulator [Acidobacteriaceae bacterium]|jgi:transcriptional regulator with XRE-family HTH domain|nr:XRE family transcriptional regulator [Acidobacteriaceae bacterium]
MAHKWNDLKHKVSTERRAQIARHAQEEVRRLALNQLRETRNLTQTNVAQALNVNQGAVSKMENRKDMYVSTLRSYLKAMGAQLQIKAIFPDGEVLIEQFEDLDPSRDDPAA